MRASVLNVSVCFTLYCLIIVGDNFLTHDLIDFSEKSEENVHSSTLSDSVP